MRARAKITFRQRTGKEGGRGKKIYVVSKGLPVSEGWKGVGFQSISGSESLARPIVVSLRARHEPKKTHTKDNELCCSRSLPCKLEVVGGGAA